MAPAVSGAEPTQAVAAVKGCTKTQLTLRPQRPRQAPRVTESDAHARVSHKDEPAQDALALHAARARAALFLCAFSGAFRGVLCAPGAGAWGLLCGPLFLGGGLLRAFSRLACRRSVLVVALCPCSVFCLPAVCSVCCSRRSVALVLCGPWAVVFLLSVPPLPPLLAHFSVVFGGCWALDEKSELRSTDCESHCRMDFAVLAVTRASRNFCCSSQQFAGTPFAFEKLAYATIRRT